MIGIKQLRLSSRNPASLSLIVRPPEGRSMSIAAPLLTAIYRA